MKHATIATIALIAMTSAANADWLHDRQLRDMQDQIYQQQREIEQQRRDTERELGQMQFNQQLRDIDAGLERQWRDMYQGLPRTRSILDNDND